MKKVTLDWIWENLPGANRLSYSLDSDKEMVTFGGDTRWANVELDLMGLAVDLKGKEVTRPKKLTACEDCRHCIPPSCLSPKMKYFNCFVGAEVTCEERHGLCYEINKDGHCKGFEQK